jgi:hypothetical protein
MFCLRNLSLSRLSWALCGAAMLAAASSAADAQVKLNTGDSNFSLKVLSWREIPFRTVVRQQYDYSCGSAALATLLRFHYDKDVGEAEIFKSMFMAGDQAKIQKVGFSLLDMKDYLSRKGIRADGFRMTLDDLQKAGKPAITVISVGPYKHFVVIKGVEKDLVLVGDPALGLKKYTRADFAKMWGGIVFLIDDDKLSKGLFNNVAEWRPFNPSPYSQALDAQSLFGLNTATPAIYQIMQVNNIAGVPQL